MNHYFQDLSRLKAHYKLHMVKKSFYGNRVSALPQNFTEEGTWIFILFKSLFLDESKARPREVKRLP